MLHEAADQAMFNDIKSTSSSNKNSTYKFVLYIVQNASIFLDVFD